MRRLISLAVLFICAAAVHGEQPGTDKPHTKPRERDFKFDYSVTVNDISAGDKIRMWLPMPQSNNVPQVARLVESTLPGQGQETQEPKYGNRMVYRELTAESNKPIVAKLSYEIERQEVKGLDASAKESAMTNQTRSLFLSANSKVPIKNIPLNWNRTSDDVIETARSIYDRVDEHVRYDKSNPGYGSGDTLWVCDSRFGNCTDFHSLFISMARASKIPSRFEIGFPLPTDKKTGTIGGYHCWASFYTEDYGWVPVDISEADKHPEMKSYYFGNITADRVHFSTGRDIDLVPQQSAPALNYFVYPHVEINGQVALKEQLDLSFVFTDMSSNEQN